MAEIQSKLMTS